MDLESLPKLKAKVMRARPAIAHWIERARSGSDRLTPFRDRLAGQRRKHPKLAAASDTIASAWATLVGSVCVMIDPFLSRYFPDMRLVAVLTVSGDIELHKSAKGAVTPLGELTALGAADRMEVARVKWTAIELRLPADKLLQRTLSLPAASRDFLGPIIAHRLERLTPWRPEQVLYGYRVLDEPEAGGGVSVALTATSKDFVAAPLRTLGDAGLMPSAIGADEDPFSKPLSVDIFDHPKAARVDSRKMVSRIALASFGFLTIANIGSSLWASSALNDEQEAGIRLMKARRLLKTASMGAIGDRERALLEAKRPDKAVIILIDKLATAIPQDTYLKELAVTPDKVRVVGISANAPALIGELEATGLANVRFTSAVTREKDQKDSFEITADRAASVAEDTP